MRLGLGLVLLLGTAAAAHAAYSPATTDGWFVVAGRVAGLNDSLFRTDLWIFNPDSSASATVTLTFRQQDGLAAPVVSSGIVLAPGQTRFFPDATFASPLSAGDNKVGSLEWQSDRPVMAAARVYTTSPSGTYGFFLPGIPASESLPVKAGADDTLHVLQIFASNSGDANFRTNLDITNTSTVSVTVQVSVIDPTTGVAYGGTRDSDVAAKSLLRLGQILVAAGAPRIDGLRIEVAIPEGTSLPGGGILAVATTLDNRTNDAFAFVGQRVTASGDPVQPLSVAPSATDASIDDHGQHHLVYLDPGVGHAGKLFVFLAGSGGAPQFYQRVCQVAAARGYHALGLSYPNAESINEDICAGSPDPDCQEKVRLETLDGTDRTPLVDVNPANSIENRLLQLLTYLARERPGEGWDAFLSAGQLRWDRIAVAGHSQGGGHAAMIGKVHAVQRVAMFSATEPAPWTTEPLATPPDRFYGFAHQLEESVAAITRSWRNLQIPGMPTRVDGDTPPFGGSHQLTTQAIPAGPLKDGEPNWHGCGVVDFYTPLASDGKTPLFQDVWGLMIGP